MYIWIHDKYSSTPAASSSVFEVFGRLKNGFDITELIFQIKCVTVVQWSRSCLHVQINRVRLPATLFSVSLCRFFFCLVFVFNTIFTFGLFSFILTVDSADHAHWSIYIFPFKSGVLFWKRDFKSSWSAYWPSLRPEKTISSCRLLWNSWIFFNVSWHHDKHSTPQTALIYT